MATRNTDSDWAIITGASSGIGKALAFQFAAGGFNLVLIARNEAALKEVAADCSNRHGIESEVLAADLSNLDSIDRVIEMLTSSTSQPLLNPSPNVFLFLARILFKEVLPSQVHFLSHFLHWMQKCNLPFQ